jgi:hypothetical protein
MGVLRVRRVVGPVLVGGADPEIRGVQWNQSTDTWTRIDVNGNTVSYNAADFNDHAIWGEMTRVNLATDGTENAVYGDGSYAEDGTNGRVMVRIPKFWYKTENPSANVYRWWISDIERSGFSVHPAFFQRGGSPATDYIYIGAYEADGYDDGGTFKLHSRAGVTPVTGTTYPDLPGNNLDIDEAETYANNIGSGWGAFNIWSYSAIKLLFMIEYSNLDSQTELGRGIVDKASGSGFAGEDTASFNVNDNLDAQLTGCGDDGYAGEAQDGLRPVTWRGVENIWGNAWQFILGFNALDAECRVVNRSGLAAVTIDGDLGAGDYESSTAAPIEIDGYIDNIETETLLLPLLIGSSTGGGSATYIPDYQWGHDTGEVNILLLGGRWNYGMLAGVGSLFLNRASSYSYQDIGARVEFRG